jgi:hypothetical protein
MTKWVLICRVIDLIGYTDDAIRSKISKGVWLFGVHWIKAPDGRLMFNLEAIQKWIESKA